MSDPNPGQQKPALDELRNPWATLSIDHVYENPWIRVEHHEVIDPSGKSGIYGVVRPRNFALGVIPVFSNGDTLLVGQFRYALDRYSWEIPEGGGDKAVPPIQSIQRELAEETGLTAGSWMELQTMTLSNSVTDEIAICWVAWDLTEGRSEPESTEDLTVWRVAFTDAVELVTNGTIHDAMTVATVQALELRRLKSNLPSKLRACLEG
jgi:8-oxo-dGTP pyrophosphatase MutT (NUDIX family)